jgi:hypothetical protein
LHEVIFDRGRVGGGGGGGDEEHVAASTNEKLQIMLEL